MKEVPAVMHIEMSLDMLKSEKDWMVADMLKEYRTLGTRVDTMTFPPGCSEQEKGYLVGLYTGAAIAAMRGFIL